MSSSSSSLSTDSSRTPSSSSSSESSNTPSSRSSESTSNTRSSNSSSSSSTSASSRTPSSNSSNSSSSSSNTPSTGSSSSSSRTPSSNSSSSSSRTPSSLSGTASSLTSLSSSSSSNTQTSSSTTSNTQSSDSTQSLSTNNDVSSLSSSSSGISYTLGPILIEPYNLVSGDVSGGSGSAEVLPGPSPFAYNTLKVTSEGDPNPYRVEDANLNLPRGKTALTFLVKDFNCGFINLQMYDATGNIGRGAFAVSVNLAANGFNSKHIQSPNYTYLNTRLIFDWVRTIDLGEGWKQIVVAATTEILDEFQATASFKAQICLVKGTTAYWEDLEGGVNSMEGEYAPDNIYSFTFDGGIIQTSSIFAQEFIINETSSTNTSSSKSLSSQSSIESASTNSSVSTDSSLSTSSSSKSLSTGSTQSVISNSSNSTLSAESASTSSTSSSDSTPTSLSTSSSSDSTLTSSTSSSDSTPTSSSSTSSSSNDISSYSTQSGVESDSTQSESESSGDPDSPSSGSTWSSESSESSSEYENKVRYVKVGQGFNHRGSKVQYGKAGNFGLFRAGSMVQFNKEIRFVYSVTFHYKPGYRKEIPGQRVVTHVNLGGVDTYVPTDKVKLIKF